MDEVFNIDENLIGLDFRYRLEDRVVNGFFEFTVVVLGIALRTAGHGGGHREDAHKDGEQILHQDHSLVPDKHRKQGKALFCRRIFGFIDLTQTACPVFIDDGQATLTELIRRALQFGDRSPHCGAQVCSDEEAFETVE